MGFTVFYEPTALLLWVAVYITAALCFVYKRGKYVMAFFCGLLTVTAVIITLVFGATLTEIGTELALLTVLCLIAARVTANDV